MVSFVETMAIRIVIKHKNNLMYFAMYSRTDPYDVWDIFSHRQHGIIESVSLVCGCVGGWVDSDANTTKHAHTHYTFIFFLFGVYAFYKVQINWITLSSPHIGR